MIASPARGRLAWALLALAAVLAPAAAVPPPAAAQAGAPVQLVPPPKPADGDAVTPVTGVPSAAGNPSGNPAPKGIEVDRLAAIDPDTLGTLDPNDGGLGLDLWHGTTRAELAALIPALPNGLPSPTLRNLQRKLLLSSAAPPQGAAADAPPLAALRARKLLAMGATEDLRALLKVLPGKLDDEGLTRSRIEADLLGADLKAPCGEIKTLIHRYHDLFWQKALVFCQLADGKSEEAQIGIGLLREQGDNNDAAFYTLADRLGGDRAAKIASLTQPTPLLLAMLSAAKEPYPADLPRAAEPAILRQLATSALVPPDIRLAAAERAAALGLLDPEELAAAYDKETVAPGDVANAISKAQAQYGPHARALLYRAAQAQKTPATRAEILANALALARAAGDYPVALLVDLPLVAQIDPAPELAWFALEAGRALYYSGHTGPAEAWVKLAGEAANGDRQAANAATGLWPYVRLSGKGGGWDKDAFTAWRAAQLAQKGAAADAVNKRAARLLTLLEAIGDKPPPAAWQGLYGQAKEPEPGAMPAVALWHGFTEGAEQGLRGEALLTLLVAIGGRAPQDVNPTAVAAAIMALRRLGRESDAQALAIEAAIAYGI